MVSFDSSCLVSICPTMATPSWWGEPLLQQVLIDVVTLLVVGPEGPFGSVFLHVALVVWVIVATTKWSGMHDVTKNHQKKLRAKSTNVSLRTKTIKKVPTRRLLLSTNRLLQYISYLRT